MKALSVLFGLFAATAFCDAQTINFDSAAVGSAPAGWTVAMTHAGGAPKWEVLRDDTAPSKPNVLAQTSSDTTNDRFPLCIYDKASLKDGEVSVRFKPISGNIDSSGGIVWRYKDENNYYVVRANARGNSVVLYKVENGTRSALPVKGAAPKTSGTKHPVPSQTWSRLGITFQGSLFIVTFDGAKLFEVEDSTFAEAGKIGLWTKSDSVTYFDDVQFSGK